MYVGFWYKFVVECLKILNENIKKGNKFNWDVTSYPSHIMHNKVVTFNCQGKLQKFVKLTLI